MTQDERRPILDPSIASGRRPEFRIDRLGAVVREADINQDIPEVLELYKYPFAISHLADVTPDTTVEETAAYYLSHPDSKLLVPALPDGRIIGAMTVAKEEGLYGAKFNRLVRSPDRDVLHKGVAHTLIRAGLSHAFSSEEAGGLGVSAVTVAVILDIPESDRAIKTFEDVGFELNGTRFERRCKSWDPEKRDLVFRDVRQLVLQRSKYVMRYGSDLATRPVAS